MAAKKTVKKKIISTEQKVGLAVGLTAAAVAAAGGYFLYGSPNAKKNQKKVKSWMLKAKAEVLEGLEKAEEMTEEQFMELIGTVGTSYATLKDASKVDISQFKKEMAEYWPKIAKEGKSAKKAVKKTTKKVVKAASKKTTPTSAKKTTKKTVKKTTKKAAKK